MLPLALVQLWALIGVVGALVAIGASGLLRPRTKGAVPIVARNPPARGTQFLWLIGTSVAVFWPVGVLIAPKYAYGWPLPFDFPGTPALQLFGVALAVSGGALFFLASRALGRHMTPVIQVREDHELMQTSPYRHIRHPVYTAIVSVALGQSLMYLSPPLALVAILLAVLASYRARLEEVLLSSPQAFGATYESYMARTGRFLPRVRSRASRDAS